MAAISARFSLPESIYYTFMQSSQWTVAMLHRPFENVSCIIHIFSPQRTVLGKYSDSRFVSALIAFLFIVCLKLETEDLHFMVAVNFYYELESAVYQHTSIITIITLTVSTQMIFKDT